MSDTEKSIMDNIPDFQGESDGDHEATQTQTTDNSEGGGHSSAQPSQSVDGGRGGGDRGNQAQAEIRRRHDGLIERQNPDNPATRDLVDPVTGRIVAKGGIERKVFEDGQRHARENAQLRQQMQQLQQHVGSTGEVARVGQELGIEPEQQVIALRVMSDFMKDPVRTLQMLVEEVKSKGYQIPFLEQGVTPGMDLGAIERMIKSQMAPITQRAQQEQRQSQDRANAQRQLDGFLQNYPDAEANLGTLAQMLNAQPGLTLHDAYLKMMMWANSNGLDYSQPLEAQIAALQQQSQQHTQQQPQRQQRPLPNGRSANGSAAQPVDTTRQFSENTSWSDIIRHSMEESGMTLR